MGRAPALTLLAAIASACDGNADDVARPDATIDAVPDAMPPDTDFINFPFTARFLDWDSTASTPCPIVGATWTVRFDKSRVATTDVNGTLTIPLTNYLPLLDITPPAAASTCTNPNSTYTIPGIAVAPPAVVLAGGNYVVRSLTMARVASFYGAVGAPFDATRGNLFVHVDGESRAVSISSPHAPVQVFDGDSWGPGATGTDVFFPNIELAANAMTIVTVAGGAFATGAVPLAPGAITYMTVITK